LGEFSGLSAARESNTRLWSFPRIAIEGFLETVDFPHQAGGAQAIDPLYFQRAFSSFAVNTGIILPRIGWATLAAAKNAVETKDRFLDGI
jgi:hypothetical protein